MRLTDFTDYTLRTLIYLGLHRDQVVTIREISDAYRISNNHLTKVVHHLGQSGMVLTVRGRGGGLRLACEPADINIGAVIRLTEPDFNLVECFDQARNDCVLAPACQLKDALRRAMQAWLSVMDQVTLDQILSNAGQLREAVPTQVVQMIARDRAKA